MDLKGLFSYVFGVFVVAGMLTGCNDTGTMNANNANSRYANNNTGVVTNATASPAEERCNAKMSREDYEKYKAECEHEKGSSTIGQGVNDSWLWFKTRTALLTTSDLRESTISVDVVNDVVTLRGTVADATQKIKAEQVAKGIDGVKSVKNELSVKPHDSMTNQMVNGNTSNKNSNKK